MLDALPLLSLKILPLVFGNIDPEAIEKRSRKEKWHSGPIVKETSKALFKRRLKELRGFKKRYGHCDVTRTWKENPGLGRWLAGQRYWCRCGGMTLERFRILDDLGVTWEIGSGVSLERSRPAYRKAKKEKWEKYYNLLLEYKKKNGHTRIPARYRENPGLGYWAWYQRYRKSKEKLSHEKIDRLNKAEFDWEIELGVTSTELVVRVVDGDTFYTEKRMKSIRLFRVDTPERGEEGYKEAKQALKDLIDGKKVVIYTVAKDVYSRYIAHVNVGAVSVNNAMKKYDKK